METDAYNYFTGIPPKVFCIPVYAKSYDTPQDTYMALQMEELSRVFHAFVEKNKGSI